jgi:predicted P-loop ATPase
MPKQDSRSVLTEAKRLYRLGFAIHWLRPKSKRPVETKWTTGPRKSWAELEQTYREGYNLGVRLGTPSKLKEGYLGCIDVDVKDPAYREVALEKLAELVDFEVFPEVRSGGGNGSRHLYFLSKEPFEQITYAKSKEKIEKNGRKSHVWEIVLYSTGRQMALPPSLHPESGRRYDWKVENENFPTVDVSAFQRNSETIESNEKEIENDFEIEPVDLALLDISEKVRKGILTGENVVDRSAFLLPACSALLSAGLTKNEILTVLTDANTFLGGCAYDHAQTNSRKVAARWIWRYTLKKIIEEKNAKNVFDSAVTIEEIELSEEAVKKQNAEIEVDLDWRAGIARTKEGHPRSTIGNVALILQKTFTAGFIKYDDFCYREHFAVKTPWAKKDETLTDAHTAQIRKWFGEQYGFEPGKEIIFDSLTALAMENRYDPVRDGFDALPEWDGVNRLDQWLSENFDARGDASYTAQVFRKWMVAMVMRVYCPGSKFDWMPIFEGAQGIGKSSFGRILVGEKYFIDALPNLKDKDASLALQGVLACEMGELTNLRKSEMDEAKAFLTRTIDKVRPPFGRKTIESARRCVFYGTTNRDTYLRDDTGNRRFKPIVVGKLNFRVLERDRDQLFAEAKYLFDNFIETEFSLELSGKAKIFEKVMHTEKTVKDDAELMAESMSLFLEKNPDFDASRVSITELFQGIGPFQKWRLDARTVQFAAKALRNLGGSKRKIRGNFYWRIPKNDDF